MTALSKPDHPYEQNEHNDLEFCKCGKAKSLHITKMNLEQIKDEARDKLLPLLGDDFQFGFWEALDQVIDTTHQAVIEEVVKTIEAQNRLYADSHPESEDLISRPDLITKLTNPK